jgi:hypothetical protein
MSSSKKLANELNLHYKNKKIVGKKSVAGGSDIFLTFSDVASLVSITRGI